MHEHSSPSLAWLVISATGNAIAALIVAGILAGQLGLPVPPALLFVAAVFGALPRLWLLLRHQWQAQWPEALAAFAACCAITGVSLALAWPALLPIGSSGDAVLHTIHANWIADTGRLPANDERTWEYLGEMAVYPPGVALTTVAAAGLVGRPPLEVIYPLIALVSGLSATLVVLLAVATSRAPVGWRTTPWVLGGVLLLLAHRAWTLHAFTEQSYYPMVLGLFLVLLAGAWLIVEPRRTTANVAQLALAITALVGTYPIWSAIPLALAGLLVFGRGNWQQHIGTVLLAISPALLLFVVVMLPRLTTGVALLEHEGFVAAPRPSDLWPLLLALPAAVPLARTPRGRWLLLLIGLAAGEMLGLLITGQTGLVARYHANKILFILTPLALQLLGWAGDAGSAAPSTVAAGKLGSAAAAFAVSGSFSIVLPPAQQPLNRDLVAAAQWLREQEPREARRAVAVGGRPGAQPYWFQLGLLGQKRDAERTALLATAPPTPESWVFDERLPDVAVGLDLDQPPPGAEVLQRWGRVAVLQRDLDDPAALDPLLIRYRTFWEDGRLKTGIELLQPLAGRLPTLELHLRHNGAPVNTFALPPEAGRTRVQYLGADVFPDTLGGKGYINSGSYPRFDSPATQPTGAFSLTLRLALDQTVLDERLLATWDRLPDGQFVALAPHSGELVFVRRATPDAVWQPHAADFDGVLSLTGWTGPLQAVSGETVAVALRWQATQPISQSLQTGLQLYDQAGRLVADDTATPQGGFYPTWRWRVGEAVMDQRRFWVPLDLPPGTYRLVVRVRDGQTGEEWLVGSVAGTTLAEIQVRAP